VTPKRIVTVHEAKTHLSRLLVEIAKGKEIIIAKGKVPVARLVGLSEPRPRPPVGTISSTGVTYTMDCFAPLSEDELKDWGL
jgi:antitoxin (DNA-binding transcriptional repressor) of toxin-antitoxin stability system